ncbi:MAG TPA: 3-dehydroquinate dehydratase [Mogibacterium sp.]|nr:3-dehydroquinate dehydratase [Mogibacterium sp.]
MKLLIINGPNMNLLGIREPEIYGNKTYKDLVSYIAENRGAENDLEFFQSNHEGGIIDRIQKAYFEGAEGIVINPAAYAHTSIAIRDAIKTVSLPTVEVHISEISERETFRKHSYIGDIAVATISGKGFDGYLEAIDILSAAINNQAMNVR